MNSTGNMDCDKDVCTLEAKDVPLYASQKEFNCSWDGPPFKDLYTIWGLISDFQSLSNMQKNPKYYKEFASIANKLKSLKDRNISQIEREKKTKEIANEFNNKFDIKNFISKTVTSEDIFRMGPVQRVYGKEKYIYLMCIPIHKHNMMMGLLLSKSRKYLQKIDIEIGPY